MEIGTEAPIFLFWEYLFQIFAILSLQCAQLHAIQYFSSICLLGWDKAVSFTWIRWNVVQSVQKCTCFKTEPIACGAFQCHCLLYRKIIHHISLQSGGSALIRTEWVSYFHMCYLIVSLLVLFYLFFYYIVIGLRQTSNIYLMPTSFSPYSLRISKKEDYIFNKLHYNMILLLGHTQQKVRWKDYT